MNFLKVNLIDQGGELAVTGGNLVLKVPGHLEKRFSTAKGRNLTFGIRPEHIYDQALKGSFPGGETLKAIIEVVEPIGSEVIVLAKCGSAEVTARVDPETRVKPQMPVELIFDMNRMHLFDEDTKKAY
jgi:multiple sugar transport system ATP-binding protein